jgi:hypothetical protein
MTREGPRMKAFDCTGFWWLPENPDAPAAGTLRVSKSGDLRLSLIGTLGEANGGEPFKRHRIILGSVDKSIEGNEVTLLGCVLAGTSMGSYVGGREEYRAGRGFFGEHFTTESDLQFRSVLLMLGGLSEWASSLSGLSKGETRLPTSNDIGTLVPLVSYLTPTPPSGRTADAEIILNYRVSTHSRPQEFEAREEANVLLKFDQHKPLHEIEGRYVSPLQNLMTFATDRPQPVEGISVWRGENLSDWEHNPEIRVVGSRVHPEDEPSKDVLSEEMLLTLADVELAPFAEKWLRLAERYVDAFNIFFGAQYGPPAFIDMTFVLVAQSLSLFYARTDEGIKHKAEEAQHLRHVVRALSGPDGEWVIGHLGVSPTASFPSLLQQLIEKYGAVLDPLLAHRREAFINQAATTLRYIDKRDAEERSAAAHGSDLHWLIQKLRFLMKVCFLSELGFEQAKITEMLNRNPYFLHISRLEMRKAQSQPTSKEIDISFEFIVPSDAVLEDARRMAGSPNPDVQKVGKTLLELTEVTEKTKAAVADVTSEGKYDLGVYFDFDFGDSIAAAKRLQGGLDKEVKDVANTLLTQADAIAASKTAFLRVTKRN